MIYPPRPNHPYAHAAKLSPGTDPVEIDSILAAKGPLEIEIGGGKGGFVFERLAAAPEVRVLGFEIRLKLACTVDEKLAKLELSDRARVLAEDAKLALPRIKPSGVARAVFLHFPDPWWKKRHEKRLVMSDVVLAEIVRLLEPGGALFVQTDVEDRAILYREQVETRPELTPFGDAVGDPTLAENPYGARSPREHRAIADGLPVYRMRWRRT